MKKIVFMGTPTFSVPILKALIESPDLEVVAVVTQPDRKVGRKQQIVESPVKCLAKAHEIAIFQPERIRKSSAVEAIISLQPDLIVTAAYGQIVPVKLLEAPTFGAINVHASLLPKYRGAAPIHYAVKNGDPKTGVTIMYMVKEMDAGNMIAQAEIPITEDDDTGTLFEKLSILGRDTLMEALPTIFEKTNASVPQNESEVSFSPSITKEQERIRWSATAREIHHLIRALRPRPGAYALLHGERFKFWDSYIIDEKTDKPSGTIIKRDSKELWVAAAEGTILSLLKVQPAGKRQMLVAEYLAGAPIKVGERFE
ncbi:methionyl-tRNA formyltransferase [Allofustis seminis]|uniref:methionyl-tRNA formyltransferase n=1 Tax=Allofustis seminis TaxID=166939 RepID=UPI00036AC62B|nr:methionyl-tRNA formyltransferase [Allofustis seminis]